MSTQIDLKEFLSAYLAEVDDQLQTANARLLEIDKAARNRETHPRAVRDLFRALHTMKGLSAMVGVEPAVAIAHRMEAILRSADTSGGQLAPETVDTLLTATRALERCVHELSEGKVPAAAPKSLLDLLDRFEPTLPPIDGRPGHELYLEPAIASKLASFEMEMLVHGARDGRRAIRADFSPSPQKAERGFSITSVRERVSSLAEIVKVIPVAVPQSDEAPGALSFALLLLSSASDEEIAAAVGIDPAALRVLTPGSRNVESSPAESGAFPDDESIIHRRSVVRVEVVRLDDAMEHLSTLIVTRSRLARSIAKLTDSGVNTKELLEIMRDNARQLRDLRSAILRVRMVPLAEVIDRLPLIVHGLRRESGKQVRLKLDAGHAELDKGVSERLFPALVHLVRNAVDHAIEPAEVRTALGKPAEGTISVACLAQSNTRLDLTVSDDGAGVDRAAVAHQVKGALAADDTSLLDALCRAGLSTRAHATTTSGRGMGMDIVRRIIVDQLGGELSMKTEAGAGTTFTLRVPLTISIVDAFTLECGGQRFIVPVSMVEEIIEIRASDVRYGPSTLGATRSGLIERRGETVSLVDLGAVLHVGQDRTAPRQALLVRTTGAPIAFGLDRVVGQQEAVVRPLVDALVQVQGVTGATDLGDGKPTLVLDLVSLGASLGPQRQGRAA